MREKLKQIAIENFTKDSLEIANMFLLMTSEMFKYSGTKDEENTLKVLKDNKVKYQIRTMLSGQKFVELIK
ncbi:hypothetical protein WKH56_20610 [Priestia sp. SB1]|uniref:hypothetical protein n=1 Tax=Priestia sp. SB1 TaxID=3132359 RepID=UPI00317E5E2F